MKKRFFSVAIVLALIAGMTTSSCIGKFALTNKLMAWNRTIGNKFINELVFFAFWVLPVYEVSGLADILVLNSIEFWSGSNPVAKGTKVIKGENDDYLVKCDGKGYTITPRSGGESVRLDFVDNTRTWTVTVDDQTYDLLTFIDDSHVALPGPAGTRTIVTLDERGMMAYELMSRQASSSINACAATTRMNIVSGYTVE